MENTSVSSENSEFSMLMQMLANMSVALFEIRDLLKTPKKELDDQDIEDMAVHYLIQCGPNLSEIARKLALQGIHVRRQSLKEAKKFLRFQEKFEVFKSGSLPPSGFLKDGGDLEAVE